MAGNPTTYAVEEILNEVMAEIDATEEDQFNRAYALLAVRLDTPALHCGVGRITATLSLDSSLEQTRSFTLSPPLLRPLFTLCGIRRPDGVTVFDLPAFYGPMLLRVQVFLDTPVSRRVLCSACISLQELLRSQTAQSIKQERYWGFSLRLPTEHRHLPHVDLFARHITLEHCFTHIPALQGTELHYAATVGPPRVMRRLLFTLSRFQRLVEALRIRALGSELGSGLGSADPSNPLERALLAGNYDTARELLQRCGNLCFQGTVPKSSTALHCAVRGGCSQCVRLLLRFLRRYRATVIGWDGTFFDILEWVNPQGYTALHVACIYGRIALAQLLVQAGARVDAVATITPRRGCLALAAEGGHVECCVMLLTYYEVHIPDFASLRAAPGASRRLLCDPNARDEGGKTAMHLAAEAGRAEVLLLLVTHGGCLEVADDHGETVLHVLARRGDDDLLSRVLACCELSEGSASLLYAKDHARRTARDTALRYKQQGVLRVLEAAMGRSVDPRRKEEFQLSPRDVELDEGVSQAEEDRADAEDYAFAMARPLQLSRGFSPQGYYSLIAATSAVAADDDEAERDEVFE